MKTLFLISLFSVAALSGCAQNKGEHYGDFSPNQWTFEGKHSLVTYMGKPCVKLVRDREYAYGATMAYLTNYTFTNGSIELDIATPMPRSTVSFLGVAFRLNKVDNQSRYECFYFRPFMSGRSGAMQYMPVNNGLINWPDYQAAIYQGAPVCKVQQWFHVKIDVKGPTATVFVDGKQAYQVNNLARGSSKGSVGLWLGNTPEGCFANVTITRTPAPAKK